jgi:hypothetical protein
VERRHSVRVHESKRSWHKKRGFNVYNLM